MIAHHVSFDIDPNRAQYYGGISCGDSPVLFPEARGDGSVRSAAP